MELGVFQRQRSFSVCKSIQTDHMHLNLGNGPVFKHKALVKRFNRVACLIDRLVALAAVDRVQVGVSQVSSWKHVSGAKADHSSQRSSQIQVGVHQPRVSHSLGFPLLIWDFIGWNCASVSGTNAADVGDREEVCDTYQAHTGSVQIHMSQMHVFQEL